MAKKGVSLSPAGREIRKIQKQLRAAKRGKTKAEQKKIDLKIKKLDKHYSALKATCIDPRFPDWKLA